MVTTTTASGNQYNMKCQEFWVILLWTTDESAVVCVLCACTFSGHDYHLAWSFITVYQSDTFEWETFTCTFYVRDFLWSLVWDRVLVNFHTTSVFSCTLKGCQLVTPIQGGYHLLKSTFLILVLGFKANVLIMIRGVTIHWRIAYRNAKSFQILLVYIKMAQLNLECCQITNVIKNVYCFFGGKICQLSVSTFFP